MRTNGAVSTTAEQVSQRTIAVGQKDISAILPKVHYAILHYSVTKRSGWLYLRRYSLGLMESSLVNALENANWFR